MKSLDIVNSILEVGDFERYDIFLYNEEIKTIKQDLEVLEIIKNNKVDVWALLNILRNWKNEPDYMIKAVYNNGCCGEQCALSGEEILKLKQWLEENYNDK